MELIKALIIVLLLCSPAAAGTFPLQFGEESASAGSTCSGNYGYTTAGASGESSVAGGATCYRVSLSCSATASSISGYGKYFTTADREIEFALYADNGSGTDPAGLLGNYGSLYDAASGTAKWITDSSVGETISGDPSYIWVCVQTEDAGRLLYYDTGGTTPSRYSAETWGVWPSSWPTSTDTEFTDRDWSIYVTF